MDAILLTVIVILLFCILMLCVIIHKLQQRIEAREVSDIKDTLIKRLEKRCADYEEQLYILKVQLSK